MRLLFYFHVYKLYEFDKNCFYYIIIQINNQLKIH